MDQQFLEGMGVVFPTKESPLAMSSRIKKTAYSHEAN